MIVNALNPKTALFFLAFLPQFVDPERGHVALQAAILGLVWVAIATVCDAVWALGSGSLVGAPARERARARGVERKASGGILIGLGVLATLAHPARQALRRARSAMRRREPRDGRALERERGEHHEPGEGEDAPRAVEPRLQRQRREQDRHGALEPADRREHGLARACGGRRAAAG